MIDDPIQQLSIADPDLAALLLDGLDQKKVSPAREDLSMIVDEILWGLSVETSFGRAIARGVVDLIGETERGTIDRYFRLVREAGQSGPTLGKIMAMALVSVLKHEDLSFLNRFLKTTRTLLSKGTYTLPDPLNTLSSILISGDKASGNAFLDLLEETFGNTLTYNQSKQFSKLLSKAVLSFSKDKRAWQISELRRVIETDFRLTEPFIESLGKGLDLLDRDALEQFVSKGIDRFRQNQKLGRKFLSLESKLGMDTYLDLQLTVSLSQVMPRLNRYIRARTGLALAVRSLSSLPDILLTAGDGIPLAVSDGKFIYLPDEIGFFPVKEKNRTLYKVLSGLEAGYYEFHTFDFDLEKIIEKQEGLKFLPGGKENGDRAEKNNRDPSDLESFFSLFPDPGLASDLFTLFEHGRIRTLLVRFYPGFFKMALPFLEDEARRIIKEKQKADPLFILYTRIAIGPMAETTNLGNDLEHLIQKPYDLFIEKIEQDPVVDTCAELVFRCYKELEALISKGAETGHSLQTPYNRRPRPDLFLRTFRKYDQIARKIVHQLRQQGMTAYGSDIRNYLIEQGGTITAEDLNTIILRAKGPDRPGDGRGQNPVDFSFLDFSDLSGDREGTVMIDRGGHFPVFRYHEWDTLLGDFLKDHVLVREKPITGLAGDFFVRALARHRGLVKKIRTSFELLKPEGLTLLRKWLEGDEFDYRELLNFVVDRKAGIMPSDRLYIKRLKQERDVSVLLLVDLSRSTANRVAGTDRTVLDVEKEAIVLLCEALQVVGDSFAIAGFSGTGRLGVDYYPIKHFEDIMDEQIRQRINAMCPLRSTRTGAAIRHATYRLEKNPSKVRLLLILGDGFPNDTGYKQNYAMEDTRRALFEARSKNIYAHSITVNLAGEPRLDDLYGKIHHNVISDVRELPDKLLRIYSNLTR